MEQLTLFVDVLLPLSLQGYYTYRVPKEYNSHIRVGQRVIVQFGGKRMYSALVRKIHQVPPKDYTVKYVYSLFDEEPIVDEKQFLFWEWIARYYVCPVGNVMMAALPSAFRLASESVIQIHPDFDSVNSKLSQHEAAIVDALFQKNALTVDDIVKITALQRIFPLLKSMIEKNIIVMEEELQQRYMPKVISYITLNSLYAEEEELKRLFSELESKKSQEKQLLVLLQYLKLLKNSEDAVKKSDLLSDENISVSALNTLIKKGIFENIQKIESRLQEFEKTRSVEEIELSNEQQHAFENILDKWNEYPVTLLHGVTSSGKTEIYVKLIEKVLQEGKQVLFLLPEIALTAQIVNRLKKYFGNKLGVYHSRYSKNERAEIWHKTSDLSGNGFQVLLGARSAVFLPFHNLGLVVVDEEHDNSFKQHEPAPFYHARDAAIYLAKMYNAKTVLGSATPSIESFYNAQEGRYQLESLSKRYGNVLMPEIFVADMKEAQERKEIHSHFSFFLLDYIRAALEQKEQVILFQNRRGFSLRVECDKCHSVPQCKNCDVSLVYHKNIYMLRCHYCGYTIPVPETCPNCGSSQIKMKGFGTEKIEEELSIFFPEANVARMDLDSTRSKHSHMQILSDFEDRKIDILVGTQMVTKGLDFDNVSVVGVLNADGLLMFPDFRSFERSFQQLAQVSGRAGRKDKRGKVIIQTYMPYNEVIRNVIDNDYMAMYKSQIAERKVFHYPPFYRLIKITLKHKEEDFLYKTSVEFGKELRLFFCERILGPEAPPVARVRNFYLQNIMIKLEKDISPISVKEKLMEISNRFFSQKKNFSVRVSIDVDPQ